ncbi:ExeA family protein [Paludisphaera rhizosphaerae]|uniref:ExeA family protein n=1 Tax=Paludisphaera rhizosphaerae TaxID=2711216 RepID=UPI001F0EFE39|nr:AAA family ATPase [Paludisphaera rhizosphaerae]
MYEAHFGLERRPFGETACASAFVALPSRAAALRRIRYGLEQGLGPALLYGGVGVGKTLAANRLAADMGSPTVHLTFPSMPAVDLLAHLAHELGGSPLEVFTMAVALRRLREALAEHVARGRRPLLIVDEAQLVQDASVFESLRLLLNFQSAGTPDLALLLVGTGEVVFQLPGGLQDRLAARSLLPPLSQSETADYIVGRLASAGVHESLFTSEAILDLHQAALGVPRRLNHIADLALLIAYAEGMPQVDPRIVAVASREFSSEPLAA